MSHKFIWTAGLIILAAVGSYFTISNWWQASEAHNRTAIEVIEAAWKTATLLDTTSDISPVDYQSSKSWIPGIRNIYAKLRLQLDLPKIRSLSPVAVFLKGPHQENVNLTANSFGYYNPEFLNWLNGKIIPAQNNPQLRAATQPFYDAFLKDMARVYYVTYLELQKNPDVKDRVAAAYLAHIEMNIYGDAGDNPEQAFRGSGFFLQEQLRPFIDQYSLSLQDNFGEMAWYYWVVASGFWIRRSIDGTGDQFFAMLTDLLKTYDAEWNSLNVIR